MGARFVDELDFGFGWISPEPRFMQRCSHALVIGGGVWVIDPVLEDEVIERVRALGEPVGVVQLLDRHGRDCMRVADLLGVPHLEVPDVAPPGAPFEVLPVRHRLWHEVALWIPEHRTLVCAEAVGTAQYFRAPSERLAVHPLLRLTPPHSLLAVEPAHILVGHGEGVHEGAPAALRDAVEHARRRTLSWLWAGLRAHGPLRRRSPEPSPDAPRRGINHLSTAGATKYASPVAVTSDLRAQLLRLVPDEQRVNDGDSVLDQHAADLSYHPPHRPDVVVFPESADEVAAVLAFAHEHGVPVVPFGAGTSLEGHVIPLHGGISLDLTRMNAIVALRPDDLTVTVQPGVTRSQLEAASGPHGLFFPVDPGADATLGGMAATNASGTTTVRYGGMRAHVLALEVVLADGRIVRTGTRAVKTSAGYNLTNLFVGSEGTLGVITELTLRLSPIPEHVVVARAAFPSVEAACRAAAAIIGVGVPVLRCELLDAMTIGALNAFSGTAFPESPYLFVEFGGSEAGIAGDLATTRELAEDEGASAFESESDPTARALMWSARHNALMASLALSPGSRAMTTDVAVPVSELASAIEHARRALDESGLRGGIVGHAGDGNFHVAFLLDPDDTASIEQAEGLNTCVVEDALARGGTCTGEHGIGYGKIAYLEREHGDLMPLMRGIKELLDPNGIMNPGKVIPAL